MASYICTRCALRQPAMEAPLLRISTPPSARSFTSTTVTQYPRQNAGKRFPGRDANRNRGQSALRGTGLNPRTTLSVKLADLAIPRSEEKRKPLETNPTHGLYHFFNRDHSVSIRTPSQLAQHGRAWTLVELERKSFDDLHTLWWMCVRERNRIYTDHLERKRLRAGYGDLEGDVRDKTVQKTMRGIREVLERRVYAWEDARALVEGDDEIELVNGELVYTPSPLKVKEIYEEDDGVDASSQPQNSIEVGTAAVDSVAKPTEQTTTQRA